MSGPTTPLAAGQIKKGMHCVLKSRPCKIIDVSISKTGKHGHAKANFTGIDVFTGKKYEDHQPTTHTMQVPVLDRKEYDVIDIVDELGTFLTLMDESGETREDIELPTNELGEEIRKLFDDNTEIQVSVLSWGDFEQSIISYKLL